jgi:glycosyltransferase involved in cell wall biosynthesis
MNQESPLVSVCMPTYRHEEYIAQAIEGVLMQKTTFPIELRIGDDCSTDNTRKICLEYQERYPGIIKLRLRERNGGQMINWTESLKSCVGKYIAMCEGDDYWIDPLKLQKQVAFLETHPEYSVTFHNSFNVYVDTPGKVGAYQVPPKVAFDTKDLIEYKWFVPTASIVFVAAALPPAFPAWYYETHQGDYALLLLLSRKGLLHYADEFMSVYRVGGESSLTRKVAKRFAYYQDRRRKLLEHIDLHFNHEFSREIERTKRSLEWETRRYRVKQALKTVGIDLIRR